MERIFSLYGRKRRWRGGDRGAGPFSRSFVRLIAVILLLAALLLLFFNRGLYPGVSALALAAAKNEARAIVVSAFSDKMAAAGEGYEDLVTLHFQAGGEISGMSCHMPALNAARNALLAAILSRIGEERVLAVGIPLGNLLGGELLSGRGPEIPVQVLLARDASAHMESQFLSAGINQTMHRILFTVSITLSVLTPSHPTTVTLQESFVVAETVIVGKVPDAFTQINRLTDTITEQDIDDIFDFGAEAAK
jgi:sporulation protein YunB